MYEVLIGDGLEEQEAARVAQEFAQEFRAGREIALELTEAERERMAHVGAKAREAGERMAGELREAFGGMVLDEDAGRV